MVKVYKTSMFKYLEGSMLVDKDDIKLTVTGGRMETMENDGRKDEKLVIYFKETDKGLVMNKTNTKKLIAACGSDDTDDWRGATVFLYAESGNWFGKKGFAVRIRKVTPPTAHPKATAKAPPATPPPPPSGDMAVDIKAVNASLFGEEEAQGNNGYGGDN